MVTKNRAIHESPLQDEYPVLMASKLDKEDLKKILEDTKELVKIIMEEIEK